ncbi:hypothetical protein CAPTEDRAFT_187960 [Capitella teleta]|uniref:TM2 domain-containing protein n=1 Tax=Capitella teleta TaxID=283909 RepID=R7U582_CAPTE|nr:hypothetical protein CAPTEDRAFT_187960 [Capitella teleta]|eukprot:ELU01134.1 hypothetical protein CAPTEDRAFT_187960 [Capitella teleta]
MEANNSINFTKEQKEAEAGIVDPGPTPYGLQAPPPPLPSQSQPCPPPPVIYQEVAVTTSALQWIPPSKRSLLEAYMLAMPFGFLGLHHFYLRRFGFGTLYLFTFGLLGVGWLIDLLRMPHLVNEANKLIKDPVNLDQKEISDAYTMWLPWGLLGLHHYYLGRGGWGILYTFTLGIFGVGWLVDAFRLPGLVKRENEQIRENRGKPACQKKLCSAYAMTISPFGIFGTQHYYLGRHTMGLYYTLTLGGIGLGWIIDWFRMWFVVRRANKVRMQPLALNGRKNLDDAYIFLLPPGGFLGLHHFYLGRPVWGLLYMLTFGMLGVGWLIDIFRLPCLVNDINKKRDNRKQVTPGFIIHPAPHQQLVHAPVDPLNGEQSCLDQQPPSYEVAVGADPDSSQPDSLQPPPIGEKGEIAMNERNMSDALIDQRLWEMDTGFEAYKLIQLINEFNQNTSIMEI